jgi:hypothetical protein
MTKKEIKLLKNEINNLSLTKKLLDRLEGFYYYFNWQADQENKIHIHSCGDCCYGSGKHFETENGKNGVWIGPFDDVKIAKEALKRIGKSNVPTCKRCISGKVK